MRLAKLLALLASTLLVGALTSVAFWPALVLDGACRIRICPYDWIEHKANAAGLSLGFGPVRQLRWSLEQGRLGLLAEIDSFSVTKKTGNPGIVEIGKLKANLAPDWRGLVASGEVLLDVKLDAEETAIARQHLEQRSNVVRIPLLSGRAKVAVIQLMKDSNSGDGLTRIWALSHGISTILSAPHVDWNGYPIRDVRFDWSPASSPEKAKATVSARQLGHRPTSSGGGDDLLIELKPRSAEDGEIEVNIGDFQSFASLLKLDTTASLLGRIASIRTKADIKIEPGALRLTSKDLALVRSPSLKRQEAAYSAEVTRERRSDGTQLYKLAAKFDAHRITLDEIQGLADSSRLEDFSIKVEGVAPAAQGPWEVREADIAARVADLPLSAESSAPGPTGTGKEAAEFLANSHRLLLEALAADRLEEFRKYKRIAEKFMSAPVFDAVSFSRPISVHLGRLETGTDTKPLLAATEVKLTLKVSDLAGRRRVETTGELSRSVLLGIAFDRASVAGNVEFDTGERGRTLSSVRLDRLEIERPADKAGQNSFLLKARGDATKATRQASMHIDRLVVGRLLLLDNIDVSLRHDSKEPAIVLNASNGLATVTGERKENYRCDLAKPSLKAPSDGKQLPLRVSVAVGAGTTPAALRPDVRSLRLSMSINEQGARIDTLALRVGDQSTVETTLAISPGGSVRPTLIGGCLYANVAPGPDLPLLERAFGTAGSKAFSFARLNDQPISLSSLFSLRGDTRAFGGVGTLRVTTGAASAAKRATAPLPQGALQWAGEFVVADDWKLKANPVGTSTQHTAEGKALIQHLRQFRNEAELAGQACRGPNCLIKLELPLQQLTLSTSGGIAVGLQIDKLDLVDPVTHRHVKVAGQAGKPLIRLTFDRRGSQPTLAANLSIDAVGADKVLLLRNLFAPLKDMVPIKQTPMAMSVNVGVGRVESWQVLESIVFPAGAGSPPDRYAGQGINDLTFSLRPGPAKTSAFRLAGNLANRDLASVKLSNCSSASVAGPATAKTPRLKEGRFEAAGIVDWMQASADLKGSIECIGLLPAWQVVGQRSAGLLSKANLLVGHLDQLDIAARLSWKDVNALELNKGGRPFRHSATLSGSGWVAAKFLGLLRFAETALLFDAEEGLHIGFQNLEINGGAVKGDIYSLDEAFLRRNPDGNVARFPKRAEARLDLDASTFRGNIKAMARSSRWTTDTPSQECNREHVPSYLEVIELTCAGHGSSCAIKRLSPAPDDVIGRCRFLNATRQTTSATASRP